MNVFNNAGNQIRNFFPETTKAFGHGSAFLSTNSLVSKVVFLLLVLILFIFLFRTASMILGMFFLPSQNPKLVKGMKDAKKIKVISQNPKVKGSIPVMRSNNQRGGVEFTWTVWLFIDDLQYKMGQRKHIFHKGSEKIQDHTAFPNNAPGLYLHPTRNSLIVVMNTFENIMEEVDINDIPMNKWINIGIRVKGKTMDIYVNGRLALRHIFKSVPKQNYGNVFVNMNGGFSGNLSDLWYHSRALTGTQIADIVSNGPDLTMDDTMIVFPPYFSTKWFFENGEAPRSPAAPHWPLDSKNNTGL
jgi:hypothetical protein